MRSHNVKNIVDLSEFLCRSLPVVKDDDELKKLEERLKDVRKSYYEPENVSGQVGARDEAARLAFSLVLGTIDLSTNKNRSKVSMDVLFIGSHAKTFGPRLKTHVWRLFEGMVNLTAKQEKMYERWVSPEGLSFNHHNDGSSDDDSNTDGEGSVGVIYDNDRKRKYWDEDIEWGYGDGRFYRY